MAKSRQPGDMFRAFQAKKMKASGPVKMSGSFQGKSNTLGHGGRAAQLKARGVPGGVIGALARRAQAAPGQKNFHGKKKRKAGGVIGSPMASLANRPIKNPSWVNAAPKNYGAASQASYAKNFGTVPQSSMRTANSTPMMKKKRKASKMQMAAAYKKKGSVKKKSR